MADVAKENYLHRSYRYAADTAPKDYFLDADRFLIYAESLCRSGKIREALELYERCARIAEIAADRLKPLAGCVLEAVLVNVPPFPPRSLPGVCVCAVCDGVLVLPVTLPCGHTFCRRCAGRETSRGCRRCGARHPSDSLETDILVKTVVEKLWPVDLEAARIREEGNDLFFRHGLEAALEQYNRALTLGELFEFRITVHGKLCRILQSARRLWGKKKNRSLSVVV